MLDTTKMTYDAKTNTLVAEASEVGPIELVQVWPDSCDEGVRVISHRTGREERFALERTEKRDGDVVAWHFVACNRKLGLKLVIFND